MDEGNLSQIIIVVICVIFSAFFSATETAFSTINKVRMKNLANNGSKRAADVLRLTENYGKLISTILIGNNIVNITASSVAVVVFTKYLGSHGASVSTAVMTIVILIFGEITPKSVAKDFPERFAMFVVPVVKFFCFILTPINFVFSAWKSLVSKAIRTKNDESKGLTEEELLTIVEEAQDDGGIDDDEGELIRNAIEFNNIQVSDVDTPRVDIVAVDENADRDEIDKAFCESNFTRLPVYSENIDNIIGIINQKDFYNSSKYKGDIREIMSKPLYVIPNMKISELLPLLQSNKTHLAVVSDEYGGTEGIITIEDILEELVGEIWDEHDEVVEEFKKTGENEYIVMGSADLEDMFEFFDLDFDEDEFENNTVGGWIVEEMNRIPVAGDSFVYKNLTVKVTEVSSQRVIAADIKIKPDDTEEKEDK